MSGRRKKPKGPAQTPSLKRLIYSREKGRCYWCDKKVTLDDHPRTRATRDHVLPRSKGGVTSVDNLVLSCNDCNSRKGNMLINPRTGQAISPSVLRVFLKEV